MLQYIYFKILSGLDTFLTQNFAGWLQWLLFRGLVGLDVLSVSSYSWFQDEKASLNWADTQDDCRVASLHLCLEVASFRLLLYSVCQSKSCGQSTSVRQGLN